MSDGWDFTYGSEWAPNTTDDERSVVVSMQENDDGQVTLYEDFEQDGPETTTAWITLESDEFVFSLETLQ